MRKPTQEVLDQEVQFNIDDLFFSTTEGKGIILSGNDVFVRISQYSKKELIGQPHNIIRHPHMPRTVFKLLWDYIQAGKPIAAYVKNLAKDGRYYWVLATVFPIEGGYLSIRLKPTTDIFKLIPDVYLQMREAEDAAGTEDGNDMKAGESKLGGILSSLSIPSYDDFFLKALVGELQARDKQMKQFKTDSQVNLLQTESLEKDSGIVRNLIQIREHGQVILSSLNQLFGDIDTFLSLQELLSGNSKYIVRLSQEIGLLAINAATESYRLGVLGKSLSVLAGDIKLQSDNMMRYAHDIEESAQAFMSGQKHDLQGIGFQIAGPKLQIEMILHFVDELILKFRQDEVSNDDVSEVERNGQMLVNLLKMNINQMLSSLEPLKSVFIQLKSSIHSVTEIMRQLEMTQVTGMVESTRIGEKGANFMYLFSKVQQCGQEAREKLDQFDSNLIGLSVKIDKAVVAQRNIQSVFGKILPLFELSSLSCRILFDKEHNNESDSLALPEPV